MPAEAPFDPCRQWLGIDAVELGNPCRVLGVSPQEMDPAVVVRAAEARVKLLKNIAPGPFEMARTSLIARVEEARDKVLADMVANAFRGSAAGVPGSLAMPTPPSQLAGARAGTPSFAAPAAPPPPAVPPAVPAGIAGPAWPAAEGVGGAPFVIRTTTYRRRMPMGGIFVTIAALAAAAGGLLVLVTNKTPLGGKATHGDRETAGRSIRQPNQSIASPVDLLGRMTP